MKKMGAMIFIGFKQKFIYKKAALLTICVSAFSVLILCLFWKAIYPDDPMMQAYMVRYAALSQILSVFYVVESKLSGEIRNGNIAVSLLKPWNYIIAMLQENIGKMLANIFLVGLPVFLICYLLIGFGNFIFFDIIKVMFTIILAFTILFLVRILVELSCFWVIESWSLVFLSDVIIRILSGSFIPSFIMPEWGKNIMQSLPFIWIYEMPIRIFLDNSDGLPGIHSGKVVLLQLFWIAVLSGIIAVVWNRGRKKIAVQGG